MKQVLLPGFHHLRKCLDWKHKILKLDQEVGYLFQEKPLVSYRRDKNIKDMLVKSQFLTSQNTTGVTTPCGRKSCVTCDFVFNEEHTVHGPKGSFSPQGKVLLCD